MTRVDRYGELESDSTAAHTRSVPESTVKLAQLIAKLHGEPPPPLEFVGPKGYEHGWKFVGVPGVTSHGDLLKMRTEARARLPQGHPERLKAERAVRHSRKLGATQKKAIGDREAYPTRSDVENAAVKASREQTFRRGKREVRGDAPKQPGETAQQYYNRRRLHSEMTASLAPPKLGGGEASPRRFEFESKSNAAFTTPRKESAKDRRARQMLNAEFTPTEKAVYAPVTPGESAGGLGPVPPIGIQRSYRAAAQISGDTKMLQFRHAEATKRMKAARGPSAAQAAQRAVDRYAAELRARGGKLGKNGRWSFSNDREAVGLSAETPALVATPAPLGKPGGPGLYKLKGAKLPNYIENIRNALMRGGMSEGRATATAINQCKKLALTSKHPEVKAAAAAAIAELKATAARAHAAHGTSPGPGALANEHEKVVELFNQFHLPAGPGGGRFTTKSGASGGAKAAKPAKGAQKGSPGSYNIAAGAAQRATIQKRIKTLRHQIATQMNTLQSLRSQRHALAGTTSTVAKKVATSKKSTTKKAGTKAKTTTTAKKKTQGAAKKVSSTTKASTALTLAKLNSRITSLRNQIKQERATLRSLQAKLRL